MAMLVNTVYKNNNKTIMWYFESSDNDKRNPYY